MFDGKALAATYLLASTFGASRCEVQGVDVGGRGDSELVGRRAQTARR